MLRRLLRRRRAPARSTGPPDEAVTARHTAGRQVSYSPQLDGAADPGEIVWTLVAYEDQPFQAKDRPVLIVGRKDERTTLYGLMLSSHDHARSPRAGTPSAPARGTGATAPAGSGSTGSSSCTRQAIRREAAVLDQRTLRPGRRAAPQRLRLALRAGLPSGCVRCQRISRACGRSRPHRGEYKQPPLEGPRDARHPSPPDRRRHRRLPRDRGRRHRRSGLPPAVAAYFATHAGTGKAVTAKAVNVPAATPEAKCGTGLEARDRHPGPRPHRPTTPAAGRRRATSATPSCRPTTARPVASRPSATSTAPAGCAPSTTARCCSRPPSSTGTRSVARTCST